jgi:Uma2 family endonuclease
VTIVRTVILGPPPPEVEALIESRRRSGAHRHDEVWDGDLHINTAPRKRHQLLEPELAALLRALARARGLSVTTGINIGVAHDFRIPDLTLVSDRSDELWVPTAELVVEILAPHDESRAKLPFYAAHGVQEAVIVDQVAHTIEWFRSDGTAFAPVEHSELLGIAVAAFASQIDWPPVSAA